MKKITIIGFLWTLLAGSVMANNIAYHTQSLASTNVKTLCTRYVNTETGEPVGGDPIRPFLVMDNGLTISAEGDLNNHVLEISFDEFSHNIRQYTYTLLHLNADGTESTLNSYEYVDGFTKQDITNYKHSHNTSQLYTHYSFTFPNENMGIKVSGNYAIKIYEDGDQEKTIGWVCFSVSDPQVIIGAHVRPNTDIEFNGRYQQLDIDINFGNGTIQSARGEDFFVVVRQNGRIDNQVFAPKPTFIESHLLRYTNCHELIFEGGNEYRHFDTYSTYFAGKGVDRIIHDRNDYHAFLTKDELRGQGAFYAGDMVTNKCGTPYVQEFDANGQYIVNAERTKYDVEIEAEYMWVHWTLPVTKPWFDGVVYVGGDIFNNNIGYNNRMQYDAENQCYWLTALVKQGGVDYQYWFVPKVDVETGKTNNQPKITLQRTEGSHWETENEYTIYVYYRPFGARYDKLVGLQVLR